MIKLYCFEGVSLFGCDDETVQSLSGEIQNLKSVRHENNSRFYSEGYTLLKTNNNLPATYLPQVLLKGKMENGIA